MNYYPPVHTVSYPQQEVREMSLPAEWTVNLPAEPGNIQFHDAADVMTVAFADPSDGPVLAILTPADGTEQARIPTTGRIISVTYDESTGLVFATTVSDSVHAINPLAGKERWQASAEGVVNVSEDVAVLKAGADLFGYDPENGTQQWKATLPDDPYGGVAELRSGSLLKFVGKSEDQGLVSISVDTGVEEWYYRPGDAYRWVVTEDGIFAGFYKDTERENTLVRVDERTGRESWSYECKDSIGDYSFKTISTRQNVVYIQEFRNGTVVAVDLVTGQKRWRSEERYGCEDLWVFEEGVYANLENMGDPEYELVKFDENTGRISWSVPLENEVRTLVLENGLLYVGEKSYDGSGGVSYCLDPTTGNSRWHVRFGEKIDSIECNNSPVLLQTTDMESENFEETIYAVNDSGQTLWSFTDDSFYIYDAGEERIAVSGSDQGYVLARDDGRCVIRFDTSNEWHAGGGALFVADGTTISAYPLDSDPTAFSAGGAVSGSSNTQVYGGADSSPDSDTHVYEGTSDANHSGNSSASGGPQFCPGCGSSLTEYSDVQFCPSCGRQL